MNKNQPYSFEESLSRYRRCRHLREQGATYSEIGQMFGITRQAVYDKLRKGEPKPPKDPGILFANGFVGLKGRERARMMVRIRDNFTCQDCGETRTYEEVKKYNSGNPTLKGKMKLFDVHHINGLCGKKSRSYDATDDLSGMVTLCHRCHYNRPEHTSKKYGRRGKPKE